MGESPVAAKGRQRRTLDLALDIVNGIRRLYLKSDSLAREGLDEDLHDEDLECAGWQSAPPLSNAHTQGAPECR